MHPNPADQRVWQPSGKNMGKGAAKGQDNLVVERTNQFVALDDENVPKELTETANKQPPRATQAKPLARNQRERASFPLQFKEFKTLVLDGKENKTEAHMDVAHELVLVGLTNVPDDMRVEDSEIEELETPSAPTGSIIELISDCDLSLEADRDAFPPLKEAVAQGSG